MIPKMNPKQMRKMMKQLGMEMEELEAERVIIILKDRKIIIDSPEISVIKVKGQKTYQIAGPEHEELLIPEDDVKLVAEQAGVSEEEARKALTEAGGDLANAILRLTEGKDG
ncbi:MAG: nascent polypeptide-associated complex protein [Euryarchaeota archaeon]|nr:nascent polypeptide-associated complex protein [Euryarchaeota archaeon]